MTDLHTHILPGVDDGAKTAEESIAILQAQYAQGIDTVVLTPHFYPEREALDAFLARRKEAWELLKQAVLALPQEQRCQIPRLVLGAEVAYFPGLENVEDLRVLCIGNTKNMLLELPFYPWDKRLIRQLYNFVGRTGVTPVIAHIERYFACQDKKLLEEVVDLGFPVQVGTELLGRPFSPAMKLLRQGKGHLLASDCHDLYHRGPYLMQAMELVKKKLGEERFEELAELADQLAVEE